MDPISRDSEEVVKLDNRITQKTASLLLIEDQIKEKEEERDGVIDEIKNLRKRIVVIDTSLRKKQELNNTYSSTIRKEADDYLLKAKKIFEDAKLERAEFENYKKASEAELSSKKSDVNKKEKQLEFRELVIEENEKKIELLNGLISNNTIAEGKAKDAIARNQVLLTKLESLVKQNDDILKSNEDVLKDIKNSKLELATERGAIGTLKKLYGR